MSTDGVKSMNDLALDPDEIYWCETKGCNNPATTEWTAGDEDRHAYTTYRCDVHSVEDTSPPSTIASDDQLIFGDDGEVSIGDTEELL